MDELTPEQLQAILGTDYETVLADILRRKGDAEGRVNAPGKQLGQMANGNVFLDPAGAAQNWNDRRVARNDAAAASKEMQDVLGRQDAGRRTYAEALTRHPTPTMAPPVPTAAPTPPAAPPAPTQPHQPSAPPAPPPAAPQGLGPPLADPGPRGIPRPVPTDMSNRINRDGGKNEISFLIDLLRNRR